MTRAAIVLAAGILILQGCNREKRDLRASPQNRETLSSQDRYSGLAPAQPLPDSAITGPMKSLPASSPFTGNAYAVSEGQRLYQWFNCVGCHSNGGGGIGPSLMDQQWIYGNSPTKIYETISKGRKNGMPAFGSKLPEYQIWQLVAYVRSLSGQQPRSATPARQDSLQVQPTDIRKRVQMP